MKKHICFLISMVALLSTAAIAQQFKLHAEYRNDWYGSGIPLIADIPGYPSVTLQAESANDQFVIEADNSYNKWKKSGTDPLTYLDEPASFNFFANASGVADNMFSSNTMLGHYYTTRIHNMAYQNTQAIVMATTGVPAGILSVSMNPVGVVPVNTPAVVSITTENRSPEEHFYVRYTTNNWQTSDIVEISFTGSSNIGTATMPLFTSVSTVQYYIMSSTLSLPSAAIAADKDLITLRYNNNGGSNYSFSVAQPIVTVPVTFRVNMSQQTVSPQGVRLTGSFFNWSLDSATTIMTAVGNGIYEKTVQVDSTSTIQYKFINGNSFAQQENVPQACGVANGVGGFDRQLQVPEAPTFVLTVCFGACDNCPTPVLVPVTFRVNMSQQTVSPQGVRITGSFFNWTLDSATTIMTAVGNGIFEKTVQVDSTSTIRYKFINGNSFGQQENVPQACGVSNGLGGFDRQLVVPETAFFPLTVCFGACDNCPPPPVLVPVTFRVNMSQQTVSPQGVRLTGSFFNWSLDSATTIMTSTGNGIYEKTVQVDSTSTIQYKFINGSTFAVQENVPQACGVANGVGGFDRQLQVPEAPTFVLTVCFGACDNCPTPVLVPVTFQVDMSLTPPGPDGVRLAGSFNNWSLDVSSLMTSMGNGIFSKTINLDTTSTVAYKFVNGMAFSVQESVPQACGVPDGFGGYNRAISVPNAAQSLPVVCFSSCQACTPVSAKSLSKVEAGIYPNPAGSSFFVSDAASWSEIRVFGLGGNQIHSIQNNGNSLLEIPTFDWPTGVYLVRLCGTQGTEWHKLSKQ